MHDVRRTDGNMMLGGMMFGWVVAKVGLAGFPVDMKLMLANSIS